LGAKTSRHNTKPVDTSVEENDKWRRLPRGVELRAGSVYGFSASLLSGQVLLLRLRNYGGRVLNEIQQWIDEASHNQ
jgi:hypothetical protein